MGRDELLERLWGGAEIVARIQVLMAQRRRTGANPQIDAELVQLRTQYAHVSGTLVPQHLRDADHTVAIIMEIESGRAFDVQSAIASIDATRRAKLDAAHRRRLQRIRDDAQHQANLALHSSILAEGRRTRRALRAPWRKYP